MKKLTEQDGKSLDMVNENLKALKAIFPEAFTEDLSASGDGQAGGVDFEVLRQLLDDAVDEGEEKYGLNWHGKKKARQIALMPSLGTLRPCPEESVDWDTTQNLFIEGDNLEVLKLLQKSYANKVKMIYIDPPYNTGKEFIYPDKFQDNLETYLRYTGQKDDEGFKISSNTESSGRYHTNWLNMMYPRLKLARNLLHQNGIIFISIDDTEQDNLKKLCNEIFGEENFLACIANVSNPKGRSDDKYIATAHEYVLVYKKLDVSLFGWEPEEKVTKRYNKEDAGGRYREIDLRKTGDNDRREDRPNLFYSFFHNEKSGDFYPSRDAVTPEGYIEIIPTREDKSEGNWRWELNSAKEKINILIPKYMPVRSKWSVFVKDYLTPDKRVKPTSAWTQKFANSERGSEQFINFRTPDLWRITN